MSLSTFEIRTKNLSLDDILIVPLRSSATSRKKIDTSMCMDKHNFNTPIIAANMDTICNWEMAFAMYKSGGLGPIHRYSTPEEQLDEIEKLRGSALKDLGIDEMHHIIPVAASVGIKDAFSRLNVIGNRINIVFVDVAHGHCDQVIECIKNIRINYKDLIVVAGNVATYEGAFDLFAAGAHGVKVGIGSGSACTTRLVTGVGIPQASAIANAVMAKQEICKLADQYYVITQSAGAWGPKDDLWIENIPRFIIADGGIKNSGDIAKSIAIGADFVMIGALLAGTKESPGTINELGTGRKFKVYRGMGSRDAQIHNGIKSASDIVPEGIAQPVPYKGKASNILRQLRGGLQSALSYVGAESLKDFQDKASLIEITPSAYREGEPHGLYGQEWNRDF